MEHKNGEYFYVLLIDGDVVAVGDARDAIIAFNQLIENLPPTDGLYKFKLVKKGM